MGSIIGPAVPVILGVLCIGGLGYYYFIRKRRNNPQNGRDK
jgi:LPXTG-motif cell wall-anchored protein